MSPTRPARFISLEGIDGAGKSSALEQIRAWLEQHRVECVLGREPGGTRLAEHIRSLLLTKSEEELEPVSEFLLMAAARQQHLALVIGPALAAGKWVVLDRYTDSSLAYQGYGRGVDKELIRRVHGWLRGYVEPNLTIWLDVSMGASQARRSTVPNGCGHTRHNITPDRFEARDDDFFARVRQGYAELHRAQPQRIVRLNADLPLARVQQQLKALLDTHLLPWLE